MSEPYGAFVRLKIARPNLVRWLDAPPPHPARWTDWRGIGGRWYRPGGIEDFARAADADLAATAAEAWQRLARWPSTRAALQGLIRGGDGEAYAARRIAYDAGTQAFEGGSLFFDEGLIPLLAFLALVRGGEAFLGPDEAGIAVIHDYAFAPEADDATVAALVLGPGRSSRLLAGAERSSAVGAFQGLANAMLAVPGTLPPAVDQLDGLR